MSKPDDIPQDVWQGSELVGVTVLGAVTAWVLSEQLDPDDLELACKIQSAIARAILDAVATERRVCMELAEDARYKFEPHDYEARGWNNAAKSIAQNIALRDKV